MSKNKTKKKENASKTWVRWLALALCAITLLSTIVGALGFLGH